MKHFLALLITLSLTLTAAPVHADGPVDAGWMRVDCKTTTDCTLRVPEGFRRIIVHYHHGGDFLGTAKAFTSRRHTYGEHGSFKRRLNDSVRLTCAKRGNSYECSIFYAASVKRFETTYFSGRTYMGGMIGSDF